MRELLFSQPREKTNILVETRIAFLGRELHLGKSTKNSLNLWQTRITQRNVILVGIVWESLILVWFLDENYIKPRRELSFSLLENDNSRLNIVILPLIRGENHVIRGTITVSHQVGMTDADYLAAWHQVILPLAAEFQPDLVIINSINIAIITIYNFVIITIMLTMCIIIGRSWCQQGLTLPWDVPRGNRG